MNPIRYIIGQIEDSDDFYSQNGWGREPLRNYLQTPREISAAVWPPAEAGLSITAKIGDIPIGQWKMNRWNFFLKHFPQNVADLKQHSDANVKKFAEILNWVCEIEILLERELKSKNISITEVANNCGGMVLKQYEGHGIGNEMHRISMEMLQVRGFKAAIYRTTNIKSARIMEKHGSIKFASHTYKNWGMDLDGEYAIWYKILQNMVKNYE